MNTEQGQEKTGLFLDENDRRFMNAVAFLGDTAMRTALLGCEVGMTERELAIKIEESLSKVRADGAVFTPYVAFGANSCDINHVPDDTKLAVGDAIVVALGPTSRGFGARLARTFAYEEFDNDLYLAYEQAKSIVEHAFVAAQTDAVPADIVARIEQDAAASSYDIKLIDLRCDGGSGASTCDGGSGASTCAVAPDLRELSDPLTEHTYFTFTLSCAVAGRFRIELTNTVHVTDFGCEIISRYPLQFSIVHERCGITCVGGPSACADCD